MTESGFPAYWVIDDGFSERLLQALAVSLAVHILILAMHLPQRPPSPVTGGTVLDVTFSRRHDALPAASRVPVEETISKQPLEILQQSQSHAFEVRNKPGVQESPPAVVANKSTTPSESVQPGAGSAETGGAESRYVHKPGEARVLFEINDEGRIGQIIWDMLPALTDEQFNRLEAAIRARGHPGPKAGTFVRETIDVHDYIGTSP